MSSKRIFISVFLLMAIVSGVTSLLVPKGQSPNVIEDLESNYHDLKSLYKKAVQLKALLPEEDFLSISKFLDDFKNCVDDYEYQENRSGRLLQKIYIKFRGMESIVDPSDDPILTEELLKEQARDLRKLAQELEARIDGIKTDPMMFSKEKADDLYRMIQVLKEKYSPIPDSIEGFYATKQAKESSMGQFDRLSRQKMELEAKIENIKFDKQSKDSSLGMAEDTIRNLNKRIEEIQKQIEEIEKPKLSISENEDMTNTTFHYIFLIDTSIREGTQKILEEVDSNIEALKIARESERDVFSLITFDKEVHVLAEKLSIVKNSRLNLKEIQPESRKNYFEKGLEKASQFLKNSGNQEEIPVLILYTDGMRWYYETEPVLEEEEEFGNFFWKIWNGIVNWFRTNFMKKWFLKQIKESEIHEIKKQLADFSERFSDHNLTGFVSGKSSQNQEILRDFAKALNRNEIVLQTTIGENYEYFNMARATEIFPQIFKTLSIAEKGPVSKAFLQEQIRKRIQKETEEMEREREREILGQENETNFEEKNLLKEREDLEKKRHEFVKKKDKIQLAIENLAVEIEKLQPDISSIESTLNTLKEEIQLANEKSFEREQMKKEREKLEMKYAEIRTHLGILEQLTKTVQARDHNILAIFEYVTTFFKDFFASFQRIFQNDKISNYDSLIAFYKDRLVLDGTDAENMEKICQLWLGGGYDQTVARNFFMTISPLDLVENDMEIRKIEQAVEGLYEAKLERGHLNYLKEKYEEFYLILRRKISASKMDQMKQAMNSQRKEIKSLFPLDFKKLMEKLDKKFYMMH